MTTNQAPQPPTTPTPDEPTHQPAKHPPFLPLHTTVVLLTAIITGLVIGGLTALTGATTPAAVIAGLTATGASVPVLRTLIQ